MHVHIHVHALDSHMYMDIQICVHVHAHLSDVYFQTDLLHNHHRPYARVDPEGRCVAMLMYGSDLAILPFRQGEELDVVEPTTPTGATSLEGRDILPSFTVSLRHLSETVNNVKDVQFLCGYNNPTLFLLYEATPTWAGSVHKDYNTV